MVKHKKGCIVPKTTGSKHTETRDTKDHSVHRVQCYVSFSDRAHEEALGQSHS